MKIFKAKIKEKGKETILTSELWTHNYVTIADAEKHWGVHNDDVEWYEITEEKA